MTKEDIERIKKHIEIHSMQERRAIIITEVLKKAVNELEHIAELKEENAKLKVQIEKMKRHSNCKYRSEYNEFDPYSKVCQSCCNLEKWEFGETNR